MSQGVKVVLNHLTALQASHALTEVLILYIKE